MKSLLTQWNAELVPLLNGVILENGTYHSIKPVDAPRVHLPVRLESESSRQLSDLTSLQWAAVNMICETELVSSGLKVKAGEGSMGSDGVIALLDQAQRLRWIAFFDFSNPFESVCFEGSVIIAENNLNEKWFLPIEEPWKVRIEHG